MRTIIILSLMGCFLSLFCTDYVVYSTVSDQIIDMEELIEDCVNYDVIFIGEFHGNEFIHKFQYNFIRKYYLRNYDIAFSMEMFERDVQSYLDKYLGGKISEQEFLENSRPWGNYHKDYRPIVEFAKKNQVPVLAANIPRRIASMVGREGLQALSQITSEDTKFFSRNIVLLDDEYKERFVQVMKQTPVHMAENHNERIENMYAAQSIKDDTMAESINVFVQNSKKTTIIHLNGDFHSNTFLGTVSKLQLLNPLLDIAVITPVHQEENKSPKELFQLYSNTGTYLLLIHQTD